MVECRIHTSLFLFIGDLQTWLGPVDCDTRPKQELLHRLDQVLFRLGQFNLVIATLVSLENIRLFEGSQHMMQFSRLHTVEWMCTFDMAWLVAFHIPILNGLTLQVSL